MGQAGAVHPAIIVEQKPWAEADHPCSKLQDIMTKANRIGGE